MRANAILEDALRALGGIAASGWKPGVDRAALGRGILDVALMIAALDGEVLPAERTAAASIAGLFRDVAPDEREAMIAQSLENAELVIAERKTGVTDKQLVGFLILRAARVLPAGFVGRGAADVRFALILWLAMCLSDGSFDAVERLAFWRLLDYFIPRPQNLGPGAVRPSDGHLACREELEKFVQGLAESGSAQAEKAFADAFGGSRS